MDLNLLPENQRPPTRPVVGVALEGLTPQGAVEATLAWAAGSGFLSAELPATGEAWALHAPSVSPEQRERLRGVAGPLAALSALAPNQATFDITLVSPSSAIRRASVSEIWSVCRFVGALCPVAGRGTVLIRTGVAPFGVSTARQAGFVSECLTTLDRMAGEQNVRIGLLNRDLFRTLSDFDSLDVLGLRHTGAALDVAAALDQGATGETLTRFITGQAERLVYVRIPVATVPDIAETVARALCAIGYAQTVCLTAPGATETDRDRMSAARDWWTRALNSSAAAPTDEIESD